LLVGEVVVEVLPLLQVVKLPLVEEGVAGHTHVLISQKQASRLLKVIR